MGSKIETKHRMFCGRELRFWSCCGPCMISFGVPLLVPGVTLTCVALSTDTGVESFTGLHVTGFVFLGIAIFLVCAGCVMYNVFRVKVGPLPVVLLSQADLRLTHSQRLYFNNKPTFEIRGNSAKQSTCFKVENETKSTKSNFKGTGIVSKLPGHFNKRGEEVSSNHGTTPARVVTNQEQNSSTTQSSNTESSEGSSSESDSEDYTSSSCSSSVTSSGGGETSSAQTNPPKNHQVIEVAEVNTNDESVSKPIQNSFNTLGNVTGNENSRSFTHQQSVSHTGKTVHWDTSFRPSPEDVKSEERKPSSVTTTAWYTMGSDMDTYRPSYHREMSDQRSTFDSTSSSEDDDSILDQPVSLAQNPFKDPANTMSVKTTTAD